jgi:hypothetical protein
MSETIGVTEASGSVTQTTATSGATTETSGLVEGAQSTATKSKDAGSNEFINKLKKELDNWRSKAKELEMKTLEAEGQKDKIIETLKDELKSYKVKEVEIMRSRARDQIAVKAAELGCLNPDLMLKAIDVDQFEVDRATLKITDMETVNKTLEEFKKQNPFMFKQSGPVVKDGVPGGGNTSAGKVDLTKMSTKELAEYAKTHGIN